MQNMQSDASNLILHQSTADEALSQNQSDLSEITITHPGVIEDLIH